jgi:hypothetical protein
MFTGYHLSSYINAVAHAGKEVYPLPTFVNVWMGGEGTNDRFLEFDRAPATATRAAARNRT